MPRKPKKVAKVRMLPGRDFCVPAGLGIITNASAIDYRVLFWLAENPEFAQDIAALATCASCTAQEADDSIHFWIDEHIIEIIDANDSSDPDLDEDEPIEETSIDEDPFDDSAPYSAATATVIQARPDLQRLIDMLDPLFDTALTEKQIGMLLDMLDYLNLSVEYIYSLVKHCFAIEITDWKDIKSRAVRLVEMNITLDEELSAQIQIEQEIYAFTKEVKVLFNADFRELTTREKRMVDSWYRMGYRLNLVKKAYDETIRYTSKPLIEYADAIIRRWNDCDLRSAEDIDLSRKVGMEEFTKTRQNRSFDIDDFFEAALKASERQTNKGTNN